MSRETAILLRLTAGAAKQILQRQKLQHSINTIIIFLIIFHDIFTIFEGMVANYSNTFKAHSA